MKVYFNILCPAADSRRDTFKLKSKLPLITSETDCQDRSESEKRKYFDNICICLQKIKQNPQHRV